MVVLDTPAEPLGPSMWLHDATVTVRAVDALAALGVVDVLADGPCTLADLAARFELAARPLELALEVVEHRTGIVARGADGRWCLRDGAALDMTISDDALRTVLRGGRPPRDVARVDDAGTLYASVVDRIARYADRALAQLVPALARPGQHVLELAAGATPWGRALCADDPACRVTAVELPAVIDATRASIDAAGLTDRYHLVAGDVFAIDDPEPADLVVVAGFCRLIGADRNAELFRRVARWCRSGGRVAVIDAVATPEARTAGLAGYELGLLTRTSAGRCWTLDHYAGWLTAAGFSAIDITPTPRPELCLVTARRDHR